MAVHVVLDLFRRKLLEAHLGRVAKAGSALCGPQAHPGDHAVFLAGKDTEHAHGIFRVHGFVKENITDQHCSISGHKHLVISKGTGPSFCFFSGEEFGHLLGRQVLGRSLIHVHLGDLHRQVQPMQQMPSAR